MNKDKFVSGKYYELRVPTRPNFITAIPVLGKPESVPVGMLTDSELKKIGKAWTSALIEEARKKRCL